MPRMNIDDDCEITVSVQCMSGPSYYLSIDAPGGGTFASEAPTLERAARGLASFIASAIEGESDS